MSVDTETAAPHSARTDNGASTADTIADLRRTVQEKEEKLDGIRMRIKTTKSGRASVRLAASRFMQHAEEVSKASHSSAAVMPENRSAAVSSLMSRWNAGIEREVEKTKIDMGGGRSDVRGKQQRFSRKDESVGKPNESDVTSTRRTLGPVGPKELLVEDDESVPSWAVNQQKRVVRKENARASVRDVDVTRLKRGVATRNDVVDTSSVRETPITSSNGGVAAALAKWGKMADEEAEKLERVNLVEQARREEEEKQKEREEELRKMKEEQERKEREEREKREAEERIRREKQEAEERARRLAEEKERLKKAKEEEIRMLRALPDTEPIGKSSSEVIEWLEKRIKLLDLLIAEAEADLADLEKNV